MDHFLLPSLSLRSRQLVERSLLLSFSLRFRQFVDQSLLLSLSLRSRQLVKRSLLLSFSPCGSVSSPWPLASLEAIGGPDSSS